MSIEKGIAVFIENGQLRALPLNKATIDFIKAHDKNLRELLNDEAQNNLESSNRLTELNKAVENSDQFQGLFASLNTNQANQKG